MRIILAPMEGVIDSLVRELLTAINDYDVCITEFLRISDGLLPAKAFYRLCPELHQGGRTMSGTPVRIQLLGQHPGWLSENAWRAVSLGSPGVDFNCGCPSKTVNGSGGGAILLNHPMRIYQAVSAMRQAIPDALPLTVKIRLGWDGTDRMFEIADAIQQAGASELTVHGRTKMDGYRADRINWSAIAQLRQRLSIPVVANGEIWSRQDAQRCAAITGCEALMLGRGALHVPNLCRVVKHNAPPACWPEVVKLLQDYMQLKKRGDNGAYHVARIKQWLGYLHKTYPQADPLFRQIRTLTTSAEIADRLAVCAV